MRSLSQVFEQHLYQEMSWEKRRRKEERSLPKGTSIEELLAFPASEVLRKFDVISSDDKCCKILIGYTTSFRNPVEFNLVELVAFHPLSVAIVRVKWLVPLSLNLCVLYQQVVYKETCVLCFSLLCLNFPAPDKNIMNIHLWSICCQSIKTNCRQLWAKCAILIFQNSYNTLGR